jgi:hypothetical protein
MALRFYAPKGLQDSARGFNPGKYPLNRLALKGREIGKGYHCTICFVVNVSRSGALSGRIVVGDGSPGLKPRAKPYRPVGALSHGPKGQENIAQALAWVRPQKRV